MTSLGIQRTSFIYYKHDHIMKMHDLIWYQTVEVAHIIVLRFSLIKSFIHNLHYNNYYHFLTQFHCLKCLNQMKNFLENAGIQP